MRKAIKMPILLKKQQSVQGPFHRTNSLICPLITSSFNSTIFQTWFAVSFQNDVCERVMEMARAMAKAAAENRECKRG